MSAPPSTATVASLRARLAHLTLRDERRLRRRLDRARKHPDPQRRQARLDDVAADVAAAEERVARRRAAAPVPSYPPELPISGARDELLDALAASQVVVVAGETGSGKTTQLPKLCLELGRGVRGAIGHTQPRRIAARSVAARIAEELGVSPGQAVGHKVRFADHTSDDTLVKLMTDGVLLAEAGSDRALRAYDTIIVDEAHERSLNIDFLLGYLKQLLPRRPDLKVIVTSATIDVDRFSAHFDDAPVVEVSGRTYPVEVRSRPLAADDDPDDDRDQAQGICDAVTELTREGPGDILVFLAGERDIHDTAAALRDADVDATEIVPLYARLPPAEQQRVFQPHRGRRIVLATNVAETSLTVPGIRYVVDPGTARVSRYSQRTKVQRLPVEPVSQASAAQRAGRCGREAPGVCIRLYSEEDLAARPEFTDPEILRTNLASVVLQMAALDLGDVEDFPFVDPPDRRSIRAAVQLLHELDAVTGSDAPSHPELTATGRTMAALPVDPRIARMLVEADAQGCLAEMLVVAAAMSVPDPRLRPPEQRVEADRHHARFDDPRSDFTGYLNLWAYLGEQQRALSGNALRRRCRAEHLHFVRLREWQDLHRQLAHTVGELGMTAADVPPAGDAADFAQLHRAIVAGLLSHVGMRPSQGREYVGARGTRFALWPGSALAGHPPGWVVAGELVETSRLWARINAAVEPEWVEQAAGHLVARSYGEPRFDPERGAAVADEHVTLYGVPLVAGRRVAYARVDPAAARELLLRHGLVEGQWEAPHAFVEANRALRADVGALAERLRRPDLAVDDDTIFDFYAARVPDSVVSTAHFDAWWRDAAAADPDLLTMTRADLGAPDPGDADRDHPRVWRHGSLELDVHYRFAPGADDDGVTVDVPLRVLNQVEPAAFEWQVPGLRGELVTELLRALPKDWRRRLVPLPDVARAVLDRLEPTAEPLVDALAREIRRATAVDVPRDAWDVTKVPAHLRVRFRVLDGEREVACGRDLAALREALAGDVRAALTDAAGGLEQRGQRSWTFGELPATVRLPRHGDVVRGYPALVDEGDTVGVRVLASETEQRRAMRAGTRRLLRLGVALPLKELHARLDTERKLVLAGGPHASVSDLLEDCAACAIDALIDAHGGEAWDGDGFARLRDAVARGLSTELWAVVDEVHRILATAQQTRQRLDRLTKPAWQASHADARAHLDRLVHPGFVAATGRDRLPDVVRYLQALVVRLDKIPSDPRRDQELVARVAEVRGEYVALLRRLGPRAGPAAHDIRWLLEELRVSLFAQQVGTRQRVSEARILRAITEAEHAAS